MNEKQTTAAGTLRPTKKQRELLSFIEGFIAEHGYSPSYREIMVGLNYTSVATVALHVGNLIKRGHVKKRDRSEITTNLVAASEEKWLVEKIEHVFSQVESGGEDSLNTGFDQLSVLVAALKVLGLDGAALSFSPRLHALKQKQVASVTS
jgi:hypothetical protein